MEPKKSNKNLAIGIGVAALVVIGAIAVFGAHSSTENTTPVVTNTVTPTTTTPVADTTSTSTPMYKDGTYSATGSYVSPGGLDHVGVSLTLKDDIVVAATVTPEPGDNVSKHYQGIFAANYQPLVIGKNINDITLSKVSGSSLTSGGFNDAVAQIEAQAKA